MVHLTERAEMADEETPEAGAPEEGKPESIDAMREALRKANEQAAQLRHQAKQAKVAQDELDKLRAEGMSATEKAVAEAKAQGRKEALASANQRLLRAEIRANAAGKMADPGDAAALLGDLDGFLDANGEPDSKAIAKAIDDLVKAKSYLRSAVLNPGDADGGGRSTGNGSGSDMNVLLRRAAGRA